MLLTLTKENFNALCYMLKKTDLPRPVLTDRFKVMEDTFYEVHIHDRNVPDILRASMQQPDYNSQLLHLLNHCNQLFI